MIGVSERFDADHCWERALLEAAWTVHFADSQRDIRDELVEAGDTGCAPFVRDRTAIGPRDERGEERCIGADEADCAGAVSQFERRIDHVGVEREATRR